MPDHPNTAGADHNRPVLTVSEVAQALKREIENRFPVVSVRGEVSGFKRAASGHLYFSLKDADAVLDAVCWRGTAQRLAAAPEDGMEVIAGGRLTTYPGRSKYQIVVESVEPAGEGALLKLLEDRRKRLAAEGLFDSDRKRPIPFLPEVIGVVTSPTGAVIRDILHRLADRFPRRVLMWPVLVQGDGAAEQVAAAVRGFDALPPDGPVPRPDVLIVARGGGSLEDLWAFNEEAVVRAVADCTIPVIAAVGHETDTTLIDFAADLRAPTPTAAAEMAVPVRLELLAQVMDSGSRLVGAARRMLGERRARLDGLARGLPRPDRMLGDARQRLDDRGERLANGLAVWLERRRAVLATLAGRLVPPTARLTAARDRLVSEDRALRAAIDTVLRNGRARLERAGAVLESVSYRRVLERGFAIVEDRDHHPLTSAAALTPGRALRVRLHDGDVDATVDDPADGTPRRKTRSPKAAADGPQGRLL